MEEERKYGLIYEGDIIADNITMEIALILIKALCEKNYEEVSHSFMLVVKNTLSTVDNLKKGESKSDIWFPRDGKYKCSECGSITDDPTPFCPHCGAKM